MMASSKPAQPVSRWGSFLVNPFEVTLGFASASDVAAAQSVCKSWRLPRERADRVWRVRYLHDWEPETAEDPGIANQGDKTPWTVRYGRRKRSDRA